MTHTATLVELSEFYATSDASKARSAAAHVIESMLDHAQGAVRDYASDGATEEDIDAWQRLADSLSRAFGEVA